MEIVKLSKEELNDLMAPKDVIEEQMSTLLTGEGLKIPLGNLKVPSLRGRIKTIATKQGIFISTKTMGTCLIVKRVG